MRSEALLDAIGEIDEGFIREASARKTARPWLGTAIAAALALVLGITGIVMLADRIARYQPGIVESADLTQPPYAEAPSGPEDDDTIRYYRNLTLSEEAAAFVPPETVALGVFHDAVFTREEIDGVVQRLLDSGWADMTAQSYEGIALLFSQPELDPPDLEEIIAEKQSGAVYTVTERDLALARRFIADSGLDTLIKEKTGLTLVTEADTSLPYVLFCGYYEGIKTDTYVRMSFYDDGRLAEAKVYAEVPETRPVPCLPLAEAMQNAFALTLYDGGEDLTPLTVTAVRLEFSRGLPYYIFTTDQLFGPRPLELRALAVDPALIEQDEALRAQYERLLGEFP